MSEKQLKISLIVDGKPANQWSVPMRGTGNFAVTFDRPLAVHLDGVEVEVTEPAAVDGALTLTGDLDTRCECGASSIHSDKEACAAYGLAKLAENRAEQIVDALDRYLESIGPVSCVMSDGPERASLIAALTVLTRALFRGAENKT